ncbi:MAG: aminotransferase class I/II-fold pyridoxal phosphate-dependent enzyme [Oscillospiraceae bacterium]|nr:aminotransferase class I/II-fold pyridoxal phosphate-dependent enzyme [Oscillospiraceae bacterium]
MSEKIIKTPLPGGGLGWNAVDELEIEAVTRVLKNPGTLFRYAGEGETRECPLFEQELREKIGVKGALMVASGTSALTLCLSANGIGPGDEVIVPAYTYISTASAVTNAGAVPVIAEIDESLGLDPDDVEKKITPYTKGVILVHMQGIPGRINAVRAVCKKHGIALIEDACQAIGSKYFGEYTGVNSEAFAWSLNFFKVIMCGEGGVFFANDEDTFLRGIYAHDPGSPMWKSGLSQGSKLAPYTQLGIRGNELCAAVARVQLSKLDMILGKTRPLKKKLLSCLDTPVNYVLQHVDDPDGDCGFSVSLIAKDGESAKKMAKKMGDAGLYIGSVYNEGFPDRHIYKYWEAILEKRSASSTGYPWKDPNYRGNVQYSPDMCPKSLDILSRCLRFTMNINMNETNMEEVAEAINYADGNL